MAHLAGTLKGLPRWLLFGVLNVAIYRRAKSGSYSFRTGEEWRNLLQKFHFLKVDVEPVYAGQANL
ncbi:MAG: hypothetical protein M3Y56_15760, partial [Armatimonadota bacterium]|nr:hypothetical protein [Armatimonadota bacterium]